MGHEVHVKFNGDWRLWVAASGFLFSSLWGLHDKLTASDVLQAVLKAQVECTVDNVRELRAEFHNHRGGK